MTQSESEHKRVIRRPTVSNVGLPKMLDIVGANREINRVYERGGDPSKYVTELQFPVKKRG